MQRATRALFSSWNGMRGDRAAPRLADAGVLNLIEATRGAFIVEAVDGKLPIRLASGKACGLFGGWEADLLAPWNDEDRGTLARALRLGSAGAVLIASVGAFASGVRFGAFEFLLLPIDAGAGAPARYLGSLDPASSSGWPEGFGISALRLDDYRLVWPDRAESLGAREPDLPETHVRMARIVRAKGRQFRVYDGGLAREPPKFVFRDAFSNVAAQPRLSRESLAPAPPEDSRPAGAR